MQNMNIDIFYVICSFLKYYHIHSLLCVNSEFYFYGSDDQVYKLVYDQILEFKNLIVMNHVFNPKSMKMVPFNDTTFPMITKNYRNELVNLKRSRSGGIYFPFKYRNEISKLEFNNFTQSRILVLGDESVGKSSLIDKVLDNSTGFEKGVLNYCGNTLTFINLM